MKAYISGQKVNVLCLYLELSPRFKNFCETKSCENCILNKYFDNEEINTNRSLLIKDGKILFLAKEKRL